jgi:uncharacterized protein (DUF58 family)
VQNDLSLSSLEKNLNMEEILRLSHLLKGYLDNRKLDGLLNGGHHSPQRGQSLEFAQHREYAPLDDLKHLDWKVFAKSDKYYIKQFEKENHIRAYFCLDFSNSMNFKGEKSQFSKIEFAIHIALTMALYKLNQGEAIAGITFDDHLREQLSPKTKKDYFHEILRLFAKSQNQFGQSTDLLQSLRGISEQMLPKGICLIFTDAFDFSHGPYALMDVCLELQKQGHQVVLFQVLDQEELTFPFEELTRFEGLELGDLPIQLDPVSIKKAYLQEINQYCQSLRQHCMTQGIGYHQLSNLLTLEEAIFQILGASR